MTHERLAYKLSQLERKFEQLIKVGLICAVDYENARVKVELDGRKSGWLPWFTHRAGGDLSWHAPEVNEQVCVLSPNGNPANGLVLPSLYQTDHPAPANSADISRTVYRDGMVIEHDRTRKVTRISALESAGTLIFEGKNIIIRSGVEGYYQLDLAGYVTRTTHIGGDNFETETWRMGAVFTSKDDNGFHPTMVQTPEELPA
jgi:phage baseplate assembly protein V